MPTSSAEEDPEEEEEQNVMCVRKAKVDGKKAKKKTKETTREKKEESIKYRAPKCHNVDPLTKMIASKHQKTKNNDRRTIDDSRHEFRFRNCLRFVLTQLFTLGAQMSPTTLKLLLTAMTMVSVASEEVSGGLQCYTDVEGKTIVTCNELEGFKTCFVKYNDSKFIPSAFPFGVLHQYQEAAVVGRGCSTKDKVFYKECETHSYGDSLEKMCFCSFQLCNTSQSLLNNNKKCHWTVVLVILVVLLQNDLFWVPWEPWPFIY